MTSGAGLIGSYTLQTCGNQQAENSKKRHKSLIQGAWISRELCSESRGGRRECSSGPTDQSPCGSAKELRGAKSNGYSLSARATHAQGGVPVFSFWSTEFLIHRHSELHVPVRQTEPNEYMTMDSHTSTEEVTSSSLPRPPLSPGFHHTAKRRNTIIGAFCAEKRLQSQGTPESPPQPRPSGGSARLAAGSAHLAAESPLTRAPGERRAPRQHHSPAHLCLPGTLEVLHTFSQSRGSGMVKRSDMYICLRLPPRVVMKIQMLQTSSHGESAAFLDQNSLIVKVGNFQCRRRDAIECGVKNNHTPMRL